MRRTLLLWAQAGRWHSYRRQFLSSQGFGTCGLASAWLQIGVMAYDPEMLCLFTFLPCCRHERQNQEGRHVQGLALP